MENGTVAANMASGKSTLSDNMFALTRTVFSSFFFKLKLIKPPGEFEQGNEPCAGHGLR